MGGPSLSSLVDNELANDQPSTILGSPERYEQTNRPVSQLCVCVAKVQCVMT